MPYCKNGSAARTPTNVVAPAQFVRLSPRWMSSPWAALLSFEAIGRTDGVVEMGMDGEKVFSDRLKDQQIHRLKVPMQEARVVSDATGRSSAEPSETEPEPRDQSQSHVFVINSPNADVKWDFPGASRLGRCSQQRALNAKIYLRRSPRSLPRRASGTESTAQRRPDRARWFRSSPVTRKG